MDIDEIFDCYFKDYLELQPLTATGMGLSEYSDKLPNFYSEEFKNQQRKRGLY